MGIDLFVDCLLYHLDFIGYMNHEVFAFIQSDVIAYAAAI